MKLVWIFLIIVAFEFTQAEDTPGFFLKVAKNVPRLGKRNNFLIKQGGKNVPRLGRRSGFNPSSRSRSDELKFYNHVLPFDSKFIVNFLSDELFIGEDDLKFIAWEDFDKILESDTELKKKLTSIARDKEIEDLKRLVDNNNDNEIYTTQLKPKFIPYDASRNDFKYNNVDDEDVYYYHNNEVKRSSGVKEMK